MSAWNDSVLSELFLKGTPLIDVRAPIEFEAGSIPNSVNMPIMNNDERAQVGTCYKERGQAFAIELGHKLVSGNIKADRIAKWSEHIVQNPGCQVFCFRGGLRSQVTCEWLRENGHQLYALEGGYKRLRNFFLSLLDEAPQPSLYRIGGLTGSGKTTFLNKLPNGLDLEGLARHRGSTFGDFTPQPAQVTFENDLALGVLKAKKFRHLIIEDESVTLGRITIPKRFFTALRQSPLIVLRVEQEQRMKNIFTDYVSGSNAEFFLQRMFKLKKRFKKSDFEEMIKQINGAFGNGFNLEDHQTWISMLLDLYYDPLYEKDLKRNEHLIVFDGKESGVRDYLTSLENK